MERTMRTKDGLTAKKAGSVMHGPGLKKKYRAYPPDRKGIATSSKK